MLLSKTSFIFSPDTQTSAEKLTGRKFTRLTVMSLFATHRGHIHWLCLCDCGEWAVVRGSHLATGFVQSCRCLHRQISSQIHLTHGESAGGGRSIELRAFHKAQSRCEDPNNKAYKNYGERGIKFKFTDYAEFLNEVGRRPSVCHSLNRIDNDGHYEKGNVEWATRIKQTRNRRVTDTITWNGVTLPLATWSEDMNISYSTLYQRIHKLKWEPEKALTYPMRQMKPRKLRPNLGMC